MIRAIWRSPLTALCLLCSVSTLAQEPGAATDTTGRVTVVRGSEAPDRIPVSTVGLQFMQSITQNASSGYLAAVQRALDIDDETLEKLIAYAQSARLELGAHGSRLSSATCSRGADITSLEAFVQELNGNEVVQAEKTLQMVAGAEAILGSERADLFRSLLADRRAAMTYFMVDRLALFRERGESVESLLGRYCQSHRQHESTRSGSG